MHIYKMVLTEQFSQIRISMKKVFFLLFLPLHLMAQPWTSKEITIWSAEAKQVSIIRDNWGIPHIYGKTDADCVFGLLYAQCEDDFRRIEMNYIEKLGRMAEIKGESQIYADLLIRLVLDSVAAISDYARSPAWLKKLLDAYADGINFYLYKHPSIKPQLLKRFQPWYPLLWTDGSIGAINTAGLTEKDLKAYYGGTADNQALLIHGEEKPLNGSNGFAIAASKTASGHAILYINPHVSFYFRPEVHIISQEGLNAYGAVTWGQFFIYQGFNEHCGWMHTSSAVDVADLYAESLIKKNNKWFYEYDHHQKAVREKLVTLWFSKNAGLVSKTFRVLYTGHGPIMALRNNQWLALKAVNRSMNGLIQSWKRTKARGFDEFKQVMDLRTNTSNNTLYADAAGNIAYWHGNFIPRRDGHFDWARPVDGTNPQTEWKGLHEVRETVHSYNPPNGWLQNCNSTPFTVAGAYSPKKENYPIYMAPDKENYRGINAVKVLSRGKAFTIDRVIEAGYDSYLSAFEDLLPPLLKAYDQQAAKGDSAYSQLQEPVAILRSWDLHAAAGSEATTLAIEWAQRLLPRILASPADFEEMDQIGRTRNYLQSAAASDLLDPLRETVNQLVRNFGNWRLPWGELNRYQRISADIDQAFDDKQPSLPVAMASATWGCLPSFGSQHIAGMKKRYGLFGNSFVCAVEFGQHISAKSLLTGGESGDPSSPHFRDQAAMYASGQFKEVLFYRKDILRHQERKYHPGQ